MSNQLKTRNGIPFDFVDGLRIKGVDVTNWDKVFIDQGASYVGFKPTGNLSATNVQAAIQELDNEKVGYTALADTEGAALVGYDGGNLRTVLDNAKSLYDYNALRNYAGRAASLRILKPGIDGFFYYDSADTTSADNGGTVIVSTNGRRWKRQFSGAVYVTWFGADSNGSTDSSGAFLSAMATNTNFLEVYIPPGTYRLSAPIKINRQNLTLTGAGRQTTLYPDAGITALDVAPDNGVSNTVFRDFRIYGNTNATGGISLGGQFVAFCQIRNLSIENFRSSGSFGIKLSKVQELDIDNCYIADNYNNIHFPNYPGNYVTSVHVHGQGGYIGRALNIGILLDKEVASFRVSDIVVEGNANSGFACSGFGNMVSFDNVHFEENDGPQAIYLSGDQNRKGQFSINNCFFYGNTINLRSDYSDITMSGNTGLVDTGLIIPQIGCSLFFYNNKADDGSADPITVYESLTSSAKVSYLDCNRLGETIHRVANVRFPAVSAGSDDPGTLDDYKEGIWTPGLVCATSGSITLSMSTGRYTKIGNLVTVFTTLTTSSVDSPIGELRLTGLPFIVGAGGGGSFTPFSYGLAGTSVGSLVGMTQQGSSYAVLSKYASGGLTDLSGDIQSGTSFIISFSYLAV